MSDKPTAGPPAATGPSELLFGPAAPAPWTPTPSITFAKPSRWPMFTALVLAIIAVGIAVAGWFRPIADRTSEPPTPPAPAFTDQQITDAKRKVCTTYNAVRQAIEINTNRSGGTDPTAILAVAANARLALYGSAGYLLTKLSQEPATSPELAKTIKTLANTYQDIAIGYMRDKQNSDLEEKLRAADTASLVIERLCND